MWFCDDAIEEEHDDHDDDVGYDDDDVDDDDVDDDVDDDGDDDDDVDDDGHDDDDDIDDDDGDDDDDADDDDGDRDSGFADGNRLHQIFGTRVRSAPHPQMSMKGGSCKSRIQREEREEAPQTFTQGHFNRFCT